MNDTKCPKCGSGMIDGELHTPVSVGEGRLHFYSRDVRMRDLKGKPGDFNVKAKACIECGYVEMYTDASLLKHGIPKELWP